VDAHVAQLHSTGFAVLEPRFTQHLRDTDALLISMSTHLFSLSKRLLEPVAAARKRSKRKIDDGRAVRVATIISGDMLMINIDLLMQHPPDDKHDYRLLDACFQRVHAETTAFLVQSSAGTQHLFHGITQMRDRQLMLARKCDAQLPHLDSTLPSLNTGYYLSSDASDLPFTQVRQCAEGRPFGALVEVDLSQARYDHRYGAAWDRMPVCSPARVPSGTVAVFASTVVHNGPAADGEALRIVLFQNCVPASFDVSEEDFKNQTYEFTHVQERYPGDKQRLVRALRATQGRYAAHVSEAERERYEALLAAASLSSSSFE